MDKMYNEKALTNHITQIITLIFNGHFNYDDASSVLRNVETPSDLPQPYIDGLKSLLAPKRKLSLNLIQKVEKHCARYL